MASGSVSISSSGVRPSLPSSALFAPIPLSSVLRQTITSLFVPQLFILPIILVLFTDIVLFLHMILSMPQLFGVFGIITDSAQVRSPFFDADDVMTISRSPPSASFADALIGDDVDAVADDKTVVGVDDGAVDAFADDDVVGVMPADAADAAVAAFAVAAAEGADGAGVCFVFPVISDDDDGETTFTLLLASFDGGIFFDDSVG